MFLVNDAHIAKRTTTSSKHEIVAVVKNVSKSLPTCIRIL